MATEVSSSSTEQVAVGAASVDVDATERPFEDSSKIMMRFLENQVSDESPIASPIADPIADPIAGPTADEIETMKIFLEKQELIDESRQELSDEERQVLSDETKKLQEYHTLFDDDECDDEIIGVGFGVPLEGNGDSFDSTLNDTFDEDDRNLDAVRTFDDEGTCTDDESYLSDEDDELKIGCESDSENENENEDEDEDESDSDEYENVFDNAFVKTCFLSKTPKNGDFIDQTGAVIDTLYRRLASLSTKRHKKGRSHEDDIVKEEYKARKNTKSKLKPSEGNGGPKKNKLFSKQFQQSEMMEDEELSRASTGTISTGDGNTVGIKDSFSTESIDSNPANGGNAFDSACKGVTTCAGQTSKEANEILGSAIDRVQQQLAVKIFRERYIAQCKSLQLDSMGKRIPSSPSKRLSRWLSCGDDATPYSDAEDGRESILDGFVENEDGNIGVYIGANTGAGDQEVLYKDPNNTKAGYNLKEGYDLTKCGSLSAKSGSMGKSSSSRFFFDCRNGGMMNCVGNRDDEIGTTPLSASDYKALPKPDTFKDKESNDFNPAILQAEIKSIAYAAMRMKPQIEEMAQKVENKTMAATQSQACTKAIFSRGNSETTDVEEDDVLEEESPILHQVVEERSRSYPWDESGHSTRQTFGDIVVGDKIRNDSASPGSLEQSEGIIPPLVKKSIENAELVLSESKYGMCKGKDNDGETGALPASIWKSIEHAEMIISASAYGSCVFEDNEAFTEVSLIMEPTKLCEVELTERNAIEIAKQFEEGLGVGCNFTEVSFITEPTKLCEVELTERNAIEIVKQFEEGLGVGYKFAEVSFTTEPSKSCDVEIIEGNAPELAKQNELKIEATASFLSSPSIQHESKREPEPEPEEHESIAGSLSSSVCSSTEKVEKVKKAKKRSFWKSGRSKTIENLRRKSSTSSIIQVKNDNIKVETLSEKKEVKIEMEKKSSSTTSNKKKIKKLGRLSRRKKRKSDEPRTSAHVQLSSSGNVHAVVSMGDTSCEVLL